MLIQNGRHPTSLSHQFHQRLNKTDGKAVSMRICYRDEKPARGLFTPITGATHLTAQNDKRIWTQLVKGAAELGIALSNKQVEDFRLYTHLLQEVNAQFNLTAIRELSGIVTKLHLDSLSLIPAIAAAEGASLGELLSKAWRAVDVGTGAGIPGIPLLLAWPTLSLTLIESQNKKSKFLTRVIFYLKRNASVLAERAEVVGQMPGERENYDLVVARAVAALPTLVEYTLPLARIGGLVALSKGPNASIELGQARFAIAELGGETIGIATLLTPGQAETRTAVLIRKKRPTPSLYPRRPGHPAKQPLLDAAHRRE